MMVNRVKWGRGGKRVKSSVEDQKDNISVFRKTDRNWHINTDGEKLAINLLGNGLGDLMLRLLVH